MHTRIVNGIVRGADCMWQCQLLDPACPMPAQAECHLLQLRLVYTCHSFAHAVQITPCSCLPGTECASVTDVWGEKCYTQTHHMPCGIVLALKAAVCRSCVVVACSWVPNLTLAQGL
jgi:hypothetical protein